MGSCSKQNRAFPKFILSSCPKTFRNVFTTIPRMPQLTQPRKLSPNLGSQVAVSRSEIISHGTQVDINQHLALGYVTIVDFYADWCPACRWLSPRLEQMAASDPQIALRKIDIVNWKTAVARQFTIDSLPQVSIYNRAGQLIGTVSGADLDQNKSYVAQD